VPKSNSQKRKLPPLKEGDLVITVSLEFPNHERGGVPRKFDLVCDPETMTVQLEEDLVELTEPFDPNEDPDSSALEVCKAIEDEGISMKGMRHHIAALLTAVIEATP